MIIPRRSAATIASTGLLTAMGVATTTSAAAATAPTATSLAGAKINTGKAPCKKLPNLTGRKEVPGPQDCLARQLYDSLAPACSSTSVRLNLFAKTKKSPATHGSTNGQIADNGKAKFKGSKLAEFFNGSFKDSLKPGCSATVVNGS